MRRILLTLVPLLKLPVVVGTTVDIIKGNPDPAHVSTSFAERQNLTMRMQMRRFTRLTNAFSKKFENHCHALALYFFCTIGPGSTSRFGYPPLWPLGLTDKLWSMSDLAVMVDDALPKPESAGRTSNGRHNETAAKFQMPRDFKEVQGPSLHSATLLRE